MQRFINRCLQQILKIKLWQFIYTHDVLKRAGEKKVEQSAKENEMDTDRVNLGETSWIPKQGTSYSGTNFMDSDAEKKLRKLGRECNGDLRTMGRNWKEVESVKFSRI